MINKYKYNSVVAISDYYTPFERKHNVKKIDESLYGLPIIVVSEPIVEKIKYLNREYKEVLTKGLDEVEKVIGKQDRTFLSLLNYKILNNGHFRYRCVSRLVDDAQNKLNYKTIEKAILDDVSCLLDRNSSEDEFRIEKDTNYIYIILNTNSFVSFTEMYHTLSKETCKEMLEIGIDESFVYRSVFFNTLQKNHMKK